MENAQNSAKLGEKNDNIYIYNHTHLVYKYNKSEANKMKCFICGKTEKDFDSWNFFCDDNICEYCDSDYNLYVSLKKGELKVITKDWLNSTDETECVEPKDARYVYQKFKGNTNRRQTKWIN